MSETKRDEIKSRIAAAQAREAAMAERTTGERAVAAVSDAGEAFTGFVRKHPLAAAAGGLALGILVASMFKGPRRAAARGGAQALSLATLGAEAASAFASELFDDARDAARTGAEKAGDLSESVADTARTVRREAGQRASRTADMARAASRETGKRIARAIAKHR